MKRLLVALAVLTFSSSQAVADHTPEHSAQELQRVQDLVLPPGYTDESQVWVYDFGDYGNTGGLYGLIALCQNYGG